MNYPKAYKEYKQKPIDEVCEIMADHASTKYIAQLVYDEYKMEQQFEYQKQQIELQHKNNMEILTEQLKWMKCLTILTATATVIAALAGVLLGYMLQTTKPEITPQADKQQKIQYQSEPSPIGDSPAANSTPSEKAKGEQKLKK